MNPAEGRRTLDLDVTALGAAGDGVARLPDGGACFVPRSLPGEALTVRAPGRSGGARLAEAEAVLRASPDRVSPPCRHFDACGGCALQHWADAPYAEWKRAKLVEALSRAGFAEAPVAPLLRTPPRARRRADLALRRRPDGGVSLGFHARFGGTVLDLHACEVLDPRLVSLFDPLRDLLRGLPALRREGSAVLNLLDTGPDLLLRTDGALDAPARARLAAFGAAHGVPRIAWARGDGMPEVAAQHGPAAIGFAGGAVVHPPPGAFLQASPPGEAAIRDAVLGGLPDRLPPRAAVAELHAGIGTLSFALAERARVDAFELSTEAVGALAAAAGRAGARVKALRRDLVRQPLSPAELKPFAAVVLDPPFGGAPEQVPLLARARPARGLRVLQPGRAGAGCRGIQGRGLPRGLRRPGGPVPVVAPFGVRGRLCGVMGPAGPALAIAVRARAPCRPLPAAVRPAQDGGKHAMPNRRDVLLGAAALATAPGVLAAQQQQQPAPQGSPPGAPTPRFHKMTVGSLPVAIVQDGSNRRPDATQGFVPGVSAEAVSAALAAAGTPGPALDNPYNQMVVRTRAGLVLIDTGFGQGAPPGTGQMSAAMRAAGFDPAAVTVVVISHFHGDHVGGLLAPDGTAAFPNAAIKVAEAEWVFWNDAGEESRASEARKPGFANARRRFAPYAEKVERFRPGAEVAPGITAVDTRGHSPGHVSFLIADGAAQCLVIGDAITTPALFMANPEWYPTFDMDPTQAVDTRKRLLERAAAERMPVIGYHFPFPATGRVEKAGSGYRLVPSGA